MFGGPWNHAEYHNFEQKIFRIDLLQDAIGANLTRTFSMPIAKEIVNIPHYPLWRQTNRQSAEASDYMRKIGEHFISFIHKLDSQLLEGENVVALYQRHCDAQVRSAGEYWIGFVTDFIAQTVSAKYLKIPSLSQEGERQLMTDAIYARKLLSKFVTQASAAKRGTFEIIDSILVACSTAK